VTSRPQPNARPGQASPGTPGSEAGNRPAAWPSRRSWRLGLRVTGAGLLAATGAIHLDLYLTGYRSIPIIGWMFLLQVITAFGLAAAVLATGGRLDPGARLAAAAGAGFALATLGGYLLSIWAGLFGFTEIRTTAGIVAGIIEVAAFAALATLAATPAVAAQQAGQATGGSRLPAWFRGSRLLARVQDGIPGAGRAVAGLSIAALVVLGISVAHAGGPAPASGGRAVLKTATIGGVKVLTSAQGFTLYWFAPDTPARSACYGTCAGYWPPVTVTGTPSAGPGVTGRLGTIKRSDGTTQVTYNGHPLYTYVGDTAPGQAFGNNLNLNGGLWHEVTASG
jgi:predicted lipoprotein with Yx(FWY)xxD motif